MPAGARAALHRQHSGTENDLKPFAVAFNRQEELATGGDSATAASFGQSAEPARGREAALDEVAPAGPSHAKVAWEAAPAAKAEAARATPTRPLAMPPQEQGAARPRAPAPAPRTVLAVGSKPPREPTGMPVQGHRRPFVSYAAAGYDGQRAGEAPFVSWAQPSWAGSPPPAVGWGGFVSYAEPGRAGERAGEARFVSWAQPGWADARP
jgi:hypothetical protein